VARTSANPSQRRCHHGYLPEAYEPINLLGRHNIPFAVLKASDLKSGNLDAFNLLVVFAVTDEPTTAAIADFASKGGIVVLVGAQGSYPWQTGPASPPARTPLPMPPAKVVLSNSQDR